MVEHSFMALAHCIRNIQYNAFLYAYNHFVLSIVSTVHDFFFIINEIYFSSFVLRSGYVCESGRKKSSQYWYVLIHTTSAQAIRNNRPEPIPQNQVFHAYCLLPRYFIAFSLLCFASLCFRFPRKPSHTCTNEYTNTHSNIHVCFWRVNLTQQTHFTHSFSQWLSTNVVYSFEAKKKYISSV